MSSPRPPAPTLVHATPPIFVEIGSKISSFFGGSTTGDEVKDADEEGDGSQPPEQQATPSEQQTTPPEERETPQDTPPSSSDEQPEGKDTGTKEEEEGSSTPAGEKEGGMYIVRSTSGR